MRLCERFKYRRLPLPTSQIQFGISPDIWLFEMSKTESCDWFFRIGMTRGLLEASLNLLNLLEERSRVYRFLSSKNNEMGTGPSNLLPLKSRSNNTDEDTFDSSGSWFSNWLLESRSISRFGSINRDLGIIPLSELCDQRNG